MNTQQRAIFTLATLTTTACTDPIIGTWDLNKVCIGSQCVDFPYTNEISTQYMSLTIDEDLTGTFLVEENYTDAEPYVLSTGLQAERIASGEYQIVLEPDNQTLDCNLTQTLECIWQENTEVTYSFVTKD